MFKKCYYCLLIAHYASIYSKADAPVSEKVKVEVFYETLCPGSINFIKFQLRPAVEKLASYLDVHLVPYGHALTSLSNGHYEFRCQHGPAECYGNQLHACVIDVLRNSSQATLFNACLVQNTLRRPHVGYDYRSALNWCGYIMKQDVQSIKSCVNNNRGSHLLKDHGILTKKQKLKYVPYLVVNGYPDLDGRARNNLIDTICSRIQPVPVECLRLNDF